MGETTGGAIIARMLEAEGVEKFSGIVDGTYTQLLAHRVELGIEMISPRHESVAAHMAGAYSRLTGRLGVCIASNGPGVANQAVVGNERTRRFVSIAACDGPRRRRLVDLPDDRQAEGEVQAVALGVGRRLIVVLVEQRKLCADRVHERDGEPQVVAQQVLSGEVIHRW